MKIAVNPREWIILTMIDLRGMNFYIVSSTVMGKPACSAVSFFNIRTYSLDFFDRERPIPSHLSQSPALSAKVYPSQRTVCGSISIEVSGFVQRNLSEVPPISVRIYSLVSWSRKSERNLQ